MSRTTTYLTKPCDWRGTKGGNNRPNWRTLTLHPKNKVSLINKHIGRSIQFVHLQDGKLDQKEYDQKDPKC